MTISQFAPPRILTYRGLTITATGLCPDLYNQEYIDNWAKEELEWDGKSYRCTHSVAVQWLATNAEHRIIDSEFATVRVSASVDDKRLAEWEALVKLLRRLQRAAEDEAETKKRHALFLGASVDAPAAE